MATAAEAPGPRGREHFMLALWLAVGGWFGCVALQVALYLRPAPHGGPFLAEWQRYFWLGNYYDLLGVWLVSLPFFLVWLTLYRAPLSSRWWRVLAVAQAALLTLNLLLSQVDHEILRFLGVRLSPSFVMAYAKPAVIGDALFLDVIGSDRGGAWLALVLLAAVPAIYAVWASRRLRRLPMRSVPLWLAIGLAIVPLAAPANGWRMATSQFRLRKVEPVVLAFAVDASAGYADLEPPADFAALTAEYQRAWLARSTDKGWRFTDPERPYVRAPVSAASPPAARWNVIYIQLETMRGMDTGFLRRELSPSPTPYLDRLSRAPNAAVWTRAISFGMPTINGVFATHCSVMPPSRRYITALTHVEFHCLPELLRGKGYRAEMFQAADTDWDNSTPWLRRWYDRLWRHPEAERSDRALFRRAAARIRELGRAERPFFAAIVSVTNHTPFTSIDPAFDIAGQATPAERILNTTHYADQALGELIESLKDEAWFARTLIVVTGDHGFNVGEHGQVAGQHNLYRESVWVPLVIAGRHPRLRPGRRDEPATLLDISPTLADLLGVREANPWQGHSLLAVGDNGGVAFAFRDSMLAETPAWSAVLDPADGEPRLYRRADWLQRQDLSRRYPAETRRLLERAERARRLHDYLLRQDRIWPSSSS
ncbi:MAG TPA: sulfatase-like hydrolase/transferase [Croceibacterium sp.]|nr:sulfatase-like hydrolase/transferase [Croceibacterium sp.]